jgi:hypothetical protein
MALPKPPPGMGDHSFQRGTAHPVASHESLDERIIK